MGGCANEVFAGLSAGVGSAAWTGTAIGSEVDECVEYIGRNSWQKGDGPWVRQGDVGVVVRVYETEHVDEGEYCGLSVVEFHGSSLARHTVGGSSYYRRVACEGDPTHRLPTS